MQARQPRQKYISSANALRRFHPPICNRPHERDAAAGAVSLNLGGVVGGARGQAKPAMHALLHHGIVQVTQPR